MQKAVTALKARSVKRAPVETVTLKHLAMNDFENARTNTAIKLDERMLHELELQAFEKGVEDGHAGARYVAITDVNDYRLDLARKVNVDLAINVKHDSIRTAHSPPTSSATSAR